VSPISEHADRYQLLLRVIDDADIRRVFGRHPKIEKRVRKNHQRYFRYWLKEYEREVWALNGTCIQRFVADGNWIESGRALLRAADYGRLNVRLRWAVSLWALGISPVRLVKGCVAELRKLDGYAGLFQRSITPFPSA
jgi:hypothetical protein